MKKQILLKQKQQGFILIIALILMVVMAVGAVASFRLSGMAEIINNNSRARVLSLQSAEAAVNYCRYAIFNKTGMKIEKSDDMGELWQNISNWNSSKVNVVTLDLPGNPPKPECLIENISEYMESKRIDPDQKVVAYKISARGFSPNFSADSKGYQQTGAQSWVQVIVVRIIS